MNKRSDYILLAILVLFTFVIVYDVLLWYTIATYTASFAEAKIEYLSKFPEPLRNTTLLSIIGIIVGLSTGCGSIILDNRSVKGVKKAAKVLAVINIGLAALNVFTLM